MNQYDSQRDYCDLKHLFCDPPSPLRAGRDIAGYSLGRPLAWLRPRAAVDVQDIVRYARRHGLRVAPVGRASSYWNPLDLTDCLAIDTSGLDEVPSIDPDSTYVSFGAGATVAEVNGALEQVGGYLPLYPDAFGTTSIGSLVATGCAAGIGMGRTDIDGIISGLDVVLGSGEFLRTGTSTVLGAEPFLRIGLPDLTGLFVAAQGSLGIITGVSLQYWPRPHRVQLIARLPAEAQYLRLLLQTVKTLRIRSIYETCRIVRVQGGPEDGIQFDITIVSDLGGKELDYRTLFVREHFLKHIPQLSFSEVREKPRGLGTIGRFRTPIDGLERMFEREQLAAVDVILPYNVLDEALAIAESIASQAENIPHLALRTALYTTFDYVNLGIHLSVPLGSEEQTHRYILQWAEELSCLPVSPYRWGGQWAPLLKARMAPVYSGLMSGLRDLMDPDQVLQSRACFGYNQ